MNAHYIVDSIRRIALTEILLVLAFWPMIVVFLYMATLIPDIGLPVWIWVPSFLAAGLILAEIHEWLQKHNRLYRAITYTGEVMRWPKVRPRPRNGGKGENND